MGDVVGQIVLALVVGWVAGCLVTGRMVRRECAAESLKLIPNNWWLRAIIDAKADKEKEAIL
jgi:hypothetical protein